MVPRGSAVCFIASSFFAHPAERFLHSSRDFRGDEWSAATHNNKPSPLLAPTRGWTYAHTTRSCISKRASPLFVEMATIGGTATSVWVLEGEQEAHRCPPGDSLSSPQGFLLAHPPGPYTCLRTVGQRSAAMLSFHLNRLWESAEAPGLTDAVEREGRLSLERRTTEIVAKTMGAFLSANAEVDGGCPECMMTVLYTHGTAPERDPAGALKEFGHFDPQADAAPGREGGTKLSIVAHAWPLSTPSSKGAEDAGLKVLVAGVGRSRPEAKHSSWLRIRRPLDALKAQAGAQEVIMSTVDRSGPGLPRTLLLEGLTSNLFVVEEDGAVCTAPSGVLMGGMRELCLSACEEEDIPVRLEPPDLSRADGWQEAFLTGTGRILAPISCIVVSNEEDAANSKGAQLGSDGTSSKLELAIGRDAAGTTRRDFHGSEAFRDSKSSESRPICSSPVVGVGRTSSMAQRLRKRMVARLEEGATLML